MAQRNTKNPGFQHWNTPAEVLDPLRAFVPISLDPCSNPSSVVAASCRVTLPVDGLAFPWHLYGHTFVNPPYADQPAWLAKAVAERALGAKTITVLIPASTETKTFREQVFGHADAVAFWHRRIGFTRADGGGSGNSLPSALVYFGDEPERFAEHFAPYATVVTDWTGRL